MLGLLIAGISQHLVVDACQRIC